MNKYRISGLMHNGASSSAFMVSQLFDTLGEAKAKKQSLEDKESCWHVKIQEVEPWPEGERRGLLSDATEEQLCTFVRMVES